MTERPKVCLDGHYSMTETAELLNKDRRTIYRWRKIGFLKTKKYRHCNREYVLGREINRLFGVCY